MSAPGSAAGPLGQRLLPVAAIASALALGVSEFMTVFEFNAAGGDTLQSDTAGDRHMYAMLIIAVFSIAMIVVHMRTGARAPVIAAAVMGAIAVLLFLIVDLPDVNKVGDLSDPVAGLITTRAEAQPGFWLELAGALGLAISAGLMALFSSEQPG